MPILYMLGKGGISVLQTSIFIFIFCKVMGYPCASFYTILSSHVNTTNIFQFLTIFEQNLNVLSQICIFIPIQLRIVDFIFKKFTDYYCAKFYTNAQTNADMTNISNFSRFLHTI